LDHRRCNGRDQRDLVHRCGDAAMNRLHPWEWPLAVLLSPLALVVQYLEWSEQREADRRAGG